MNDTNPALSISGLHTRIERPSAPIEAVSGISLHIDRGETLGLVGESGCGKSMTGMSVMGLLPPGGRVSAGSITLQGKELVGLSDREYQRIRGNDVAMVFQDPMTSLDPTKAIGEQIAEPYRLHRKASRREAMDRAAEMLALVGFARPAERLDAYPHQLSGGLRQRVMIAMALVCEPKVLIADEPTTALDVTVQAQVLRLLHTLKEQLGMAMLLITHDMGVVARWADRVSVMYAGKMVERSDTDRIFGATRHPYSQALLGSIPRLDQPRNLQLYSIPGAPPDLSDPPAGCRFADRCPRADELCLEADPEFRTVDGHSFACHHPVDGPVPADRPATDYEPAIAEGAIGEDVEEQAPVAVGEQVLAVDDVVREFGVSDGSFLRRSSAKVHAVSGVSLAVRAGHTFGLVGESGCGKSTLARMIVALERPDSGTVTVLGEDLSGLDRSALRRHRRNLQMMFQDPMDSLDPRMRVGAILAEPFAAQNIGTATERRDWVAELLAEVGLPATAIDRYPHEFSGGQRQRIGLARALALRPEVIVADEPVSALDVSIRSQVLNLMKTLQERHQLTYVVISHDLTVVRYLADTVGVMYLGRLVEVGPVESVYAQPVHPYTAGLISAIPEPDPAAERAKGDVGVIGEPPSPIDPPSGCRFRTRCPAAQELCGQVEPALRPFGDGHQAACHFPLRPAVQRSDSEQLAATDR